MFFLNDILASNIFIETSFPVKFELLPLFSQFKCLIIIMEKLIIHRRFTSDSL